MKITIDTKEDSHEEIRKIIRMLSSLVGEKQYTNQGNIFDSDEPTITPSKNIFDSEEPAVSPQPSGSGIFGNMFGDDSPSEEKAEPYKVTEKKREIPEIIPYD